MNNQVIAPFLRKRWEHANNKVKALSSELFPQSSYLRIDQVLSNGVGNYRFDPMKQNGQEGRYGKLWKRNDLFLTFGIGLFLNYELTANPGAAVLATSLSDLVAKAKVMGSTDTIPVDLQAVYNGSLRLQTGTTVTFDALETSIFNISHQAANSGETDAAVVSLDSSILGEIFLPILVNAFGCTPNVYDYAITYGRIILIGAPFMIIYTGLSSIIRADGSPKYSMVCLVIGAIINIVLDYIFILIFNMGVAGGALATIIGQFVSFSI